MSSSPAAAAPSEPAALDAPGRRVLLSGNEAVARGALEAGAAFAVSYPGSPTVEVLGTLARLAPAFGLHAEWSVNEIVALEEAAGASYAGLRALVSMKPDGFNVALDMATSLAVAGVKAGLVIMVGDDPAAHSGVKEEDCRALVKAAELPLLEPASVSQAKEMTAAAFRLSEELGLPVVVRATTRICHSSGDVVLGELPKGRPSADMTPKDRFFTYGLFHAKLKGRLRGAAKMAEASPLNVYAGPEAAQRLVIASGVGALYAAEALEALGLADQVGLLTLGFTFPPPAGLILARLQSARHVVFLEEIEAFVEDQVLALAAQSGCSGIRFSGKRTGEVAGKMGPGVGELTPDLVTACLAKAFARQPPEAGFADTGPALALVGEKLPGRTHTFCAGCPHRASFWALRQAIDARPDAAVVLGDIGCYTLALGPTGYHVLQTTHCMGGGLGMAVGLGQLGRFGLTRPVVAVLGDGTFYHAGVPALIQARHQNSDLVCVILDNQSTAMTGHQPHPGRPLGTLGEPAPAVGLEDLIGGIGLPVTVADPYDLEATGQVVGRMLDEHGPRVLILRRECTLAARRTAKGAAYEVDPDLCTGCGICARQFACPASRWDEDAGLASIDEALCTGCGVCASLCPAEAIRPREEVAA